MVLYILSFLIFLTIALSIYFFINWYFYFNIAFGLTLPVKTKKYLKISFWIISITFFAGEFLSHKSSSNLALIISFIGNTWLGVICIGISVFVFENILWLFIRKKTQRFVSTIICIVIIFLVSVYAIYNGLRLPVIKTITIPTDKLPENIKKFTIIQLSDLHLNFPYQNKRLQKIVESANSLNPDLVVITGDLIDGQIKHDEILIATLKNIKSKNGVFMIPGNHEYYTGIDYSMKFAQKSGLTILINKDFIIGNLIQIIGIANYTTHKRFNKETDPSYLENLSINEKTKTFSLVLSHNGEIFNYLSNKGIDLQLSGHTHKGQIPPLSIIVNAFFDYPYGLYKKNDSYLYVTSGTGIWGPPMRLFSKSEIVKIILKNTREKTKKD